MLSASVSGEIFASPSAKQIMRTIELAAFTSHDDTTSSDAIGRSKKDVLVVINNYTGDRLNFGLAIEKARRLGIELESVVVADDVSLLGSEASLLVGPRGLGGNILVCKILGALAERGATLEETKKAGDAVVANLASIGVGLEHCHIPGRAPESIPPLGKNECEIGLGLHNEPGAMKYSLEDSSRLFARMIEKVLQSRGEDDPFVRQNDDETVLFVNNLGGVSQLEMAASLNDILDQLRACFMYFR
jgi:triose/dihydroxyacetone kinase / FAD-AMP lyase (cyclizing)